MPDTIQNALPQIVKDPLHLNLSSDTIGVKTIRHVFHVEDDSQPKARNLLQAIEFHHPTSSIVFCNTKEETEVIERYLRRFGLLARALNGDMPQSARERVMQEMRESKLDLIVATDVAARGIDISGISHVFNVELPNDSEVYVHRTGRTGRIGKLGVAVNLVRAKDVMQVAGLKEKFGIDFEEVKLPSEADILWMQAQRLATLFVEAADTVEISQYRQIGEALLGRADLAEIVAFLLRSHFSQAATQRTPAAPSHEPRQRPQRERSERPERPKPAPQAAPQVSPAGGPVRKIEPRATPLPRTPEPIADESELPLVHELEEPVEQTGEQTRLYITLGRDDGFAELSELSLYIADISGVDFGFFTGMGQLRDSSSHVEVETECADKIIATFNDRDRDMTRTKGANASNPKILCEVAKGAEIKPKRRRFTRRS
jgi:ATP-dependent RNA helicase DeaD